MKKKIIAISLAATMVVSLCACTAEQAAQNATDFVNTLQTSDSKEVMSVKNGYLSEYSDTMTIGTVFDGFLSNPSWQYFVAESGEKIVQCTGGCQYNNEDITAKIQFELNDDGTFQVSAMAFNDMSQNQLMVLAFLQKIYEEAAGTEMPSQVSQTEVQPVTEEKDYSQEIDIININTYDLDKYTLHEGMLTQLNQKQVRTLLNALYAYHGYSFTTNEYINFFASKQWYTPLGKSMEECEAEFNICEKDNKELLIRYEQMNGWR